MKAILVRDFGGPEVLKLQDVPDPRPGPGQVLVEVKAAGVNPVETYIRSGKYARAPNLPYTPGSDAGGTVVAAASDVKAVRKGDRVYTSGSLSGTYAELTLCQSSQVHPLPRQVTFAQGAALGVPYATAYYALFIRAHAAKGETVLVHGASGGVGTAVVQIARSRGLTVIGTAGTPKGRDLVAQMGAHHVLDHHAPDYFEKIMALTHEKGVDVIIEMLANVNLAKDLKALAKGGRVVVVGSRGTVEIDPRDLMMRTGSILGMTLFNATEKELVEIHAALVEGLENGTLKPTVGREIPLTRAAEAHEAVMAPGAQGKIVLIPKS